MRTDRKNVRRGAFEPSVPRLLPLLLLPLLAGCGDGQGSEKGTPVESREVGAAAERCGVSRDVAADGSIVPAELRPEPAQVAATGRSEGGYTARVLYARPLREVMNAIAERAKAAGFEIAFSEFEGSDGELTVRKGGSETELRLLAVRSCPTFSQASITARSE